MPAPDVSVVVTTLRNSELLRRCLGLLRPQVDALGAELVLSVNAPREALPETTLLGLGELADAIVLEPRPGKSRALNRAVEACRGQLVAFTDDDALPEPDWLWRLTQPLRTSAPDDLLVGCGGRVVTSYPDALPPRWYRRLVDSRSMHFLGPIHDLGPRSRAYRGPERWEAPIGANCAFRRSALAPGYQVELGPNHSNGMRGGEDLELGLRLMRAGRELRYVPDAVVHHPVPAERLTLGYVRSGFLAHGVEEVRVRRALGIPPRAVHRVRRRRRKALLRAATRLLGDPSGSLELLLQAERLSGVLRETLQPGTREPERGDPTAASR